MTETPEEATAPTTTKNRIAALDGETVVVYETGKRCGLAWAPDNGNWFTSYCPRNDNTHAAGEWDHWVILALEILQDPMTAKVYPAAHAAVAGVESLDVYDGANVHLTHEDLAERFATEVDAASGGAR